jgi:ABC-type glycerol-3-phosphate transport system substrate-binding protein
MRGRAVVLAAALAVAPLSVRAADLVMWWREGYYAEENAAVRETIAAFEQGSGKAVELVFYSDDELLDRIAAGLEGARCRISPTA